MTTENQASISVITPRLRNLSHLAQAHQQIINHLVDPFLALSKPNHLNNLACSAIPNLSLWALEALNSLLSNHRAILGLALVKLRLSRHHLDPNLTILLRNKHNRTCLTRLLTLTPRLQIEKSPGPVDVNKIKMTKRLCTTASDQKQLITFDLEYLGYNSSKVQSIFYLEPFIQTTVRNICIY